MTSPHSLPRWYMDADPLTCPICSDDLVEGKTRHITLVEPMPHMRSVVPFHCYKCERDWVMMSIMHRFEGGTVESMLKMVENREVA